VSAVRVLDAAMGRARPPQSCSGSTVAALLLFSFIRVVSISTLLFDVRCLLFLNVILSLK
jgi:hypothetical protein